MGNCVGTVGNVVENVLGKNGKPRPPPGNDVSVQLSDDALNQLLDEKAGIGGDGGPPRGAYPTLELEGIPLDGMGGGGTMKSEQSAATEYGAQHITAQSDDEAGDWDGQSALSGSQWNGQSQRSGATESMRSQSQWDGESQRSGATESMRSQSQWGGESQRSGATESTRSQSQYGARESGLSSLYDDRSLPSESTRPPTLPDRTPGMFVSGRSKVSSMFSKTSTRVPSTATSRAPSMANSRAPSTATSRAPSMANSRAPSTATSRAPSMATSRAPSTATSRAPSAMGSNLLMPKESRMSDFNDDQRFSEAPSVRESGYSEYSDYSEYEQGSRAPSERSRWTESTGYSEYSDYPEGESRYSGMSTATGQLDGVRSVSQGQPSNAGAGSTRGSKISTRSGATTRSRQPSQSRGASTRSSRSRATTRSAKSTRSTTRGSSRRTGRSTNSVWTKGGKGNTMRGGDIAGIPENELYEKDSRASGWSEAQSDVSGYTEASRAQSRAQSSANQPASISEDNRMSNGWSGTEAEGAPPEEIGLGGHSRYRKNNDGKWKATQSTRNNFTPTAFRRVTVAVQALGFGGISRTGKTARHEDKARNYFKSVNPQAQGSYNAGPPPGGKLGPASSNGWSGSGSSQGIDVKRVVEGSVRKPMPSQWGRVVGNHWKNMFGGSK